jgi:ABC-2 type transport system permease protein
VAGKEAIHVVRDPRTLYLALGMPVVMIVIFGFGVSFDIEHAPIAVVDHDRSARSRELVRTIGASGEFDVVALPQDAGEVDRLFRSRRAMAAVVLPAGLQRSWEANRPAAVQLLVDGADGTSASAVAGSLLVALRAEAAGRAAAEGTAAAPPLGARVRVLFNPQLRSAVFFVPGLIAAILTIAGVLLTALTIAREWERGNMEQLFATPVGRLEVVFGKLLPYLAVGAVQALLILVVGMVVFDVPLRGDLPTLGAGTFLFLLGTLGQGLLISVVTRNQQVATQVGAIVSLLPGILLSGFVFPIENMPLVLRGISAMFPARYFVAIIRGVLLRGNGVDVLWGDFLGLVVFAGIVMTLATVRFRRRLA